MAGCHLKNNVRWLTLECGRGNNALHIRCLSKNENKDNEGKQQKPLSILPGVANNDL